MLRIAFNTKTFLNVGHTVLHLFVNYISKEYNNIAQTSIAKYLMPSKT